MMVTRRIPAEATHALRRAVLRDGRPDAVVVFPGDDDPTTAHFGAYPAPAPLDGGAVARAACDVEAAPLAIVSLYLAPLKNQSLAQGVPTSHQYQFRGMASDPRVRGMGYADAVMRAMLDSLRTIRTHDTPALLWCNARTSAAGFYQRYAMRVVTPEFHIPDVGPHVVMTLLVT